MSDERLDRLFGPEISLERIGAADHPSGNLIRRCVEGLASINRGSGGAVAYYVPGRIEVLGKHTDYCGGRSLVCAIDRGFVFVAAKRADKSFRVLDALRNDSVEVPISDRLTPKIGHWSNYSATAMRRVIGNFGSSAQGLCGIDIVFASDLPAAAGLSSSSALIVGSFLTIAALNRLNRTPTFMESIGNLEELAHYCGCIENGSAFRNLAGIDGVGTSGGSQDHVAIFCCKAGVLSQYGFSPVSREREITMPREMCLMVMLSGVVAEKTGAARSKYNAVSDKARYLVSLWNLEQGSNFTNLAQIVRSGAAATPGLHGLIDRSDSVGFPKQELHDRLEQFVTESEMIIPAASEALGDCAYEPFGELIARSTKGAIEKLRNQVPQTVALVKAAHEAGAIAASPFGAGFGGSVWAMIKREQIDAFRERLPASVSGQMILTEVAAGAVPIS